MEYIVYLIFLIMFTLCIGKGLKIPTRDIPKGVKIAIASSVVLFVLCITVLFFKMASQLL